MYIFIHISASKKDMQAYKKIGHFWTLVAAVSSKTPLTHWGRVTHICASELTIIGSDNGLSPSRRQAMVWTSAGILLIRPSGTNFSESKSMFFSFKKMNLKMSSAKCRPFDPINQLKISPTTSSSEIVIATIFTFQWCSIPRHMAFVLGLHKCSLQATMDHPCIPVFILPVSTVAQTSKKIRSLKWLIPKTPLLHR